MHENQELCITSALLMLVAYALVLDGHYLPAARQLCDSDMHASEGDQQFLHRFNDSICELGTNTKNGGKQQPLQFLVAAIRACSTS
jgi:hypothetical protein